LGVKRKRFPIDRVLGLQVSTARREVGISQEQLAEKANLSRNHISLIETGASSPTVRALFGIATALETSPSNLLKAAEESLREAARRR